MDFIHTRLKKVCSQLSGVVAAKLKGRGLITRCPNDTRKPPEQTDANQF
jgi:hypothetical protein